MKKDKIKIIIELIIFICILCTITFVYYFGGKDIQVEKDGEVNIIKITDDNFEEEVLNSEKPVILEFSSNSCPPCITMLSTMINIAKNNEDIKVGSVNSEDNTSNLLKEYNIEAFPTIIIFKNGEIQKVFLGVTSEEAIMNEIEEWRNINES